MLRPGSDTPVLAHAYIFEMIIVLAEVVEIASASACASRRSHQDYVVGARLCEDYLGKARSRTTPPEPSADHVRARFGEEAGACWPYTVGVRADLATVRDSAP